MQDITWTPEPPSAKKTPTYTLRRTTQQKVLAICLSPRPIGANTHFWRGRTRPCTGLPNCEACNDGQTSRWKGYIALYDQATRAVWIHEITENAFAGLAEGIESFTQLRGHWIRLERTRPTTNAPVTATVLPTRVHEEQLPPEPDIKAILYRIWDINETTQPAKTQTTDQQTRIQPSRPPRQSRNGDSSPANDVLIT